MTRATFNSDPVEAAYASAALRTERAEQRRQMRDLAPSDLVARIVAPTFELGTLPLEKLFVPTKRGERPIPRFGFAKFQAALRLLHAAGHRWAHPRVRLGDLSQTQRQLLAAAIVARSPRRWRGAA